MGKFEQDKNCKVKKTESHQPQAVGNFQAFIIKKLPERKRCSQKEKESKLSGPPFIIFKDLHRE